MKKRLLTYKLCKTTFCFVAFMFLSSSAMAQVARISNSGGNWNDPARWTPNGVPTALDNVTIAHNVTINANNMECANLTVNAGATLNHQGGGSGDRFTVNGNFIVNGTYNSNNNAGRPTYIFGDFMINGTYTTSSQGDARQHIIMRKGGATIGGTGAAMSGSNVFCHLTIDLTDTSGGNYVTLARNITIGAENNSPNLNLTNGHLLASGYTITSGSENNMVINANNGYNFVNDASYCSGETGPNLVINGTSGRGVEVNGTISINNLSFTSGNASFPRNASAQITVNGNFSRTSESNPTINARFNWGPESSYSISNTSWSLGSSPRNEWNGVVDANAPATINSVVNEAKVPCGRTVRAAALATDVVGATAYRLRAYNLECGAGNYVWGIGSTTLTSTGNDTYDVYTSGTYWVACDDLVNPVSTNPLTITPRIQSTGAINAAGTTNLTAIGLGAPNDTYEWFTSGCGIGSPVYTSIGSSTYSGVEITSTITYWVRKAGEFTCASITFTIPTQLTSSRGYDYCEGNVTTLTASGLGGPMDVYEWQEQLTGTNPVARRTIIGQITYQIDVNPNTVGTATYWARNVTTNGAFTQIFSAITLRDCCAGGNTFGITKICGPIVIDGVGDEPEWNVSPWVSVNRASIGSPGTAGQWRMMYDEDGNIYVFVRVFSSTAPNNTNQGRPNSNGWNGPSVELYLDAGNLGGGCVNSPLQIGFIYPTTGTLPGYYNNQGCQDIEWANITAQISRWTAALGYWELEVRFPAAANNVDLNGNGMRTEVGINVGNGGRTAQAHTWTANQHMYEQKGSLTFVGFSDCTSVRASKTVSCDGGEVDLSTRLTTEISGGTYTWQQCFGDGCTNASGTWVPLIPPRSGPASSTTVITDFGVASKISYRVIYNDGISQPISCPVEINKGLLTATAEHSPAAPVCTGDPITIEGHIGGTATTAVQWGWKYASTNDYRLADWITTPVDYRLSDDITKQTYSKASSTTADNGYYFFVVVGDCEAVSQGVQVNVSSGGTATLTLTPTSQQVCSEASSQNITIQGGTASTFDWRIVVSGGSLDGFNSSQIGTGVISINGQQLNLASGETTAAIITYYITPKGVGGCSSDGAEFPVTVTVNPKSTIETATSNTPVCEGETLNLQLTTNGTSYTWTGPNSFTSSEQNPSINDVTTAAGGSYKIVVSNAAGCKDSTTTSVTVNPKPTLTNHVASHHCSGEMHPAVDLTDLLAGATFSWTTATTGNIVAGFTTSAIDVITIPAYEYATSSATTTDTVIYRITPKLNECVGDEIEYKIPVRVCQDLDLEPISSISICEGETTIVSLVARNHAGVVANDVTVRLEPLPAGLEYVSTIKGTYNNATRIWTVVDPLPAKVGIVPGTDTLKIEVRGIAAGNSQEILSYISYANGGSIDYANYAAVTEENHKATNTVMVHALPTITPLLPITICENATLNLTSDGGGTCLWSGPNSFSSTAQNPSISNAGLSAAGTYKVVVTNSNSCKDSTTVSVTVNAKPTITPLSPITICEDATLNLTSDGGGTYLWSGPNSFSSTDQNPSISNAGLSAAGTYKVVVTSSNSCKDSTTVSVTVNAKPTITPLSPITICEDATLNLTSNGGGTYLWSGPNSFSSTSQNPSITNAGLSAAGTYKVIVTGSNSCKDSTTVSVTVNAKPTITPLSPITICEDATLNLTSDGGGTYLWSGPNSFSSTAQNPSISNAGLSAAGTYKVIVTGSNSCKDSTTVSVSVNAKPTITPLSPITICEDATLNLTSDGGGTYLWSGPNSFSSTSQNPNISNAGLSATGSYKVVVTSSNSCKDSTTVSVTVNAKPTITPLSPITICEDATLNLTSNGGGTYLWSGPNSFSSTAQNPSISNAGLSAAGTYKVVVTSSNSCKDSTTVSVTVNAKPTITPLSSITICEDATLNLTSDGGGTYLWSGPNSFSSTDQNPSISNAGLSAAGTYKVIVTGSNSCKDSTTVSVSVNAKPTITPLSPITICEDATLNLTSDGGGTYLWSGPNSFSSTAQNPSISNAGLSAAGTYKVIVTGSNSCKDSTTVSVTVNAKPIVAAITGGDEVCVGKDLQLISSPAGGTWKVVSGTASGTIIGSGLLTAGSTAGTLTVRYIVTNISGCVDSSAITITVNGNPIVAAITGGDEVCVDKDLQLISSPAGGIWKVVSGTASGTITNSGLLTAGSTSGTLTVRYIVTNISGCVDSVSLTVNVNETPTITSIIGGNAVCLDKDLQLSSTPTGGTWKIVNSTATGTTINSSGLLTASNTVGTLTVRYIVTNISGCVDSVALTVTVNDCKSNPPLVVYHTEDCQGDPECDEQPNCWQTGDCTNAKVPAPYGHYNACAIELGGKIPFAHLVVVPDRTGLKFYNVPTGGTPLTNAADLEFNPSVAGIIEVWVTYTEPEPHKTESERVKLIIKVHQSIEDLELIFEKLYHDNTGFVSPGQEVLFRAITTAPGVNYTWTDANNARFPNVVEHTLRLYKDHKITVSVANNMCPAVTRTITVPVVWPTAITPYDLDGYNDDFLVGTDIFMTIFNRYGQKVYEGRTGWDGTYRGKTADPGTYYYVAELPDGDVKKGAIEVVRMK